MDSSTENRLWEQTGVSASSEIEDFPFGGHRELVSAVSSGIASIGIDYTAARSLAPITSTSSKHIGLLALSWVPYLATIIVSIATREWGILVGLPTALLGTFLASPYNPLRHIILTSAIAAISYCIYVGTVLTTFAWSAFAFASAVITVRIVNRVAWTWAHRTVVESEAFAAYLWQAGKLYVKARDSRINSAADRNFRGTNE